MEQQLLEILKTHVLMSKEEFVEYVNLKKFYDTISELDKNAENDIEKYISYKESRKKELEKIRLDSNKDVILKIAFRRDRMELDTINEQLSIKSSYFGFKQCDVDVLINDLGYTIEELIDYIKYEWSIKENKEVLK